MTIKRHIFSVLILSTLIVSCKKDKTELNLQLQLKYQGSPLVMLEDYSYPDGRLIQFTRVSFFISDLSVEGKNESVILKEVDFVNPTSAHLDATQATMGYKFLEDEVALSQIDRISFNIGLRPDQNKTVPADHVSGSALARPGEYWIAWDSYIFAKIEGWIDLDNDGTVETGIALHLGSDNVFRTASFDVIEPASDITLSLDLYNVFQRERIYDIESNPQLHSLSQLPAAEELATNLSNALKLEKS